MKKQLANIVTSIRIVLALVMFRLTSFGSLFYILYVICGISDLIDGPIARKTNSQSELGARLDTVGDVLTYAAVFKLFIHNGLIRVNALLRFLIPLATMAASVVIGKLKFGEIFFIHNFLGKVIGWECFFLPLSVVFNCVRLFVLLLWVTALLAGIEMILIQLKSDKPSPDVLSIFQLI